MKSNKLDELKKEFDLLWGIAPKGTLKHDRGHQIKKLIQKAFEAGELEMLERVVLELPVPFGALSKVERKQIIKWIKEELNHVVKMNESRAYSLYEMHSNEANRIKKEWGFND